MMEVMEDREVWRLNLELLPPQPSRKSGQWRKKKKKKLDLKRLNLLQIENEEIISGAMFESGVISDSI